MAIFKGNDLNEILNELKSFSSKKFAEFFIEPDASENINKIKRLNIGEEDVSWLDQTSEIQKLFNKYPLSPDSPAYAAQDIFVREMFKKTNHLSIEPHAWREEFMETAIRSARSINELANTDRHNPILVGKFNEIQQQYGIVGERPIKGDGNCYFRAVIYGYLEQIIMNQDGLRTPRLDDFINRLTVIQKNIPVEFQKDYKRLLTTLQQAQRGEIWRSIHELEQNLKTNDDLDRCLVIAARYLADDYLVKHLNQEVEGLTVETMISASYDVNSIDEYRNHYLKQLGQDAEGAFVELAFLPKSLGCIGETFLIDRREEVPLQQVQGNPERNDITMPPLTLSVLLRPGHYSLLYNQENYKAVLHDTVSMDPIEQDLDILKNIVIHINRNLNQIQNPLNSSLLNPLIKNGEQFLIDAQVKSYVVNCRLALAQFPQETPSLKSSLSIISNLFQYFFNYIRGKSNTNTTDEELKLNIDSMVESLALLEEIAQQTKEVASSDLRWSSVREHYEEQEQQATRLEKLEAVKDHFLACMLQLDEITAPTISDFQVLKNAENAVVDALLQCQLMNIHIDMKKNFNDYFSDLSESISIKNLDLIQSLNQRISEILDPRQYQSQSIPNSVEEIPENDEQSFLSRRR